MTPEQISEQAKQILENERFKQAFANVRENAVSQLEVLPPGNDDLRNELVITLQVLKAVRQDIENDLYENAITNSEELI